MSNDDDIVPVFVFNVTMPAESLAAANAFNSMSPTLRRRLLRQVQADPVNLPISTTIAMLSEMFTLYPTSLPAVNAWNVASYKIRFAVLDTVRQSRRPRPVDAAPSPGAAPPSNTTPAASSSNSGGSNAPPPASPEQNGGGGEIHRLVDALGDMMQVTRTAQSDKDAMSAASEIVKSMGTDAHGQPTHLSPRPTSAQLVRYKRLVDTKWLLHQSARTRKSFVLLSFYSSLQPAVDKLDENLFQGPTMSDELFHQLAQILKFEDQFAGVPRTGVTPLQYVENLLTVARASSIHATRQTIVQLRNQICEALFVDSFHKIHLDRVLSYDEVLTWVTELAYEVKLRPSGGGAPKTSEQKTKSYMVGATSARRAPPLCIDVRVACARGASEVVRALVDTGAARTLVDAGLARARGLRVRPDTAAKLSGPTGASLDTCGVTALQLHVGAHTLSEPEALVVNGLRYPIIIGEPWLRRVGASLTANGGKWSVNFGKATATATAAHESVADVELVLESGESVLIDDVQLIGALSAIDSDAPQYKFTSPVDEMMSKVDLPAAAEACNVKVQELESLLRHQLGRLHAVGLLRTRNAPSCDGPLPAIKSVMAHLQLKPGADLSDVTASHRPLGTRRAAALQAKLEKMEMQGIIRRVPAGVRSLALSQAFVIPKHDDHGRETGEWRMVVDMRGVNKQLESDNHPTPLISEILKRSAKGKVRSKFDVSDQFSGIEVDAESKPLLHVLANNQRYEYQRLVQGLATAPAIAQRTSELVFGDIDGVDVYIDDISVYGEHPLRAIVQIVDRCLKYNVSINASKSYLLQVSMALLGHQVGPNTVAPQRRRVDLLANWPAPRNKKECQRFLGMAGWMRQFVARYAELAARLHAKQSQSQFTWDADDQAAFVTLKQALREHITKRVVQLDRPVILYTDASRAGTAFAFVQCNDNGDEEIVEMGGYGLTDHQRRYAVHDLETLALQHAFESHPDLFTQRHAIEWRCDNQTAVLVLNSKMPLDKGSIAIANFVLRVQDLNIRAVKIDSAHNAFADAVSRVHDQFDSTVAVIGDDDEDGAAADSGSSDGNATPAMLPAASTPTSPARDAPVEEKAAVAARSASASAERASAPQVSASAPTRDAAVVPVTTAAAPTVAPPAGGDAIGGASTVDTTAGDVTITPLSAFPIAGATAPRADAMEWARAQRADPSLKEYFQAANGVRVAASAAARMPCVEAASGRLYVRDALDPTQTRLVVPVSRVQQVLRLAHDSVDGGHAGPRHTRFVLEQSVWWPTMIADVTKYTQSCILCRSTVEVARDAAIGELYEGARRFGVVFIDWIPMPAGRGDVGGFYLARDTATGWIQLYPFSGPSGANVVSALQRWIADHDNPDVVHTDAGSEVTSAAVKEYASKENFELRSSSVANQRSNAIVERAVRDVKKLFLIYAKTKGDVSAWPYAISSVSRAYNRRYSESRGASPFQLVFGGLPHYAYLGALPINNVDVVPKSAGGYVQQLGTKIAEAVRVANARRHDRHERNARYVKSIGKSRADIKVGSYVMLANTSYTADTYFENKQRQSGPFKVTDINTIERRAMLMRCADNATVGPIALNRLTLVDSTRVEEVTAGDEALGIAAWRGVTDPALLMPNEQAAARANVAAAAAARASKEAREAATRAAAEQKKGKQAELEAAAAARHREAERAAIAKSLEAKEAQRQLNERRKALPVKAGAVPTKKMFTTEGGAMYLLSRDDIEQGKNEEWITKVHPKFTEIAAAYDKHALQQQQRSKVAAQRSRRFLGRK